MRLASCPLVMTRRTTLNFKLKRTPYFQLKKVLHSLFKRFPLFLKLKISDLWSMWWPRTCGVWNLFQLSSFPLQGYQQFLYVAQLQNFTINQRTYQVAPQFMFPSKQTTVTEFCSAWVQNFTKSHVGQMHLPPSLAHHTSHNPHNPHTLPRPACPNRAHYLRWLLWCPLYHICNLDLCPQLVKLGSNLGHKKLSLWCGYWSTVRSVHVATAGLHVRF